MVETPAFIKDAILVLRVYGSGITDGAFEKVSGGMYQIDEGITPNEKEWYKIATRFLASTCVLSNLPEETRVMHLSPLANQLADVLELYGQICQSPEKTELGPESLRTSICVLNERLKALNDLLLSFVNDALDDIISKFAFIDISILVCVTDTLTSAIAEIQRNIYEVSANLEKGGINRGIKIRWD